MDVFNRLFRHVPPSVQPEAVPAQPTSSASTPAGRDSARSESPAPAAKVNAAKSRFAFTRRLEADDDSVHHNNHRHASEADRALILDFDQRIAAARATGNAQQKVTKLLNELLDNSIFEHRTSTIGSALAEALTNFYNCPRNAGEDYRRQYSNVLAEACVALVERDAKGGTENVAQLRKDIAQQANDFLKTNRLNQLGFEFNLQNQLASRDGAGRGSAQKMALETFIKAFPLTVTSSGKDHIELLKKLIRLLPILELHQVADRNAQRRGVLILEKALEHLSPNGVAEIVAYLMDYVRFLSIQLTQRAARHAVVPGKIQKPVILTGAAGLLGAMGLGVAAVGGVASIGLAGIPPGVAALLISVGTWMGIEKQVRGTALYMLKRQLFKLREQWGDVGQAERTNLINSFASLRAQLPMLYATKKYTLARFFRNSNIDPGTFQQSNGRLNRFGTFPLRLHDRIVAPIGARLLGPPTVIPALARSTLQMRQLIAVLTRYEAQFAQESYANGRPPASIDWNKLVERLKDKDGKRAAYILACFNRIRELPEYKDPYSRPVILEQLMKMCQALIKFDDKFVDTFADVAWNAQGNCENNARQMFRQLWTAVVSEMAMRGEDGLNDPAALLRLAHQEFRKESLHLASVEVLRNSVSPGLEVENYIAVEIMLKQSLGILDAISGMAYQRYVSDSLTEEKLNSIEEIARKRIANDDLFSDFLMKYSPLTENIKRKSEYGYTKLMAAEKERIKKLEVAFSDAEEGALPESGEPEEGAVKAFVAAGEALKTAQEEAETKVLKECIRNLLAQHADVTRIDAPAQMEEEVVPMLPEIEVDSDLSLSAAMFKLFNSLNLDSGRVATPAGLDAELFSKFRDEIAKIHPRFQDNNLSGPVHETGIGDSSGSVRGPRASTVPQTAISTTVQAQYVAPEPTAVRSPILLNDLYALGYRLSDNPGGGDCMLYALGASDEAAIRQMRLDIASIIEQRDETDAQRNYNAHLVTSALSQTPETANLAVEMMGGRHSVPNRVYAQMVRIPKIYIGEDELSAFSQLRENIVLVDSDGTIARFRNGTREAIPYEDASKNEVLARAIAGADIALYKTPHHWQRIVRTDG